MAPSLLRSCLLPSTALENPPGTLSAGLEGAIEVGLVVAGEPYLEGGRQRRDYTLTQTGRDELQAEADRLAHAARAVTRRLRLSARTATS